MAKTRPGWRLYPRGFIGGIPATKMERMEPQTTSITHEHGHIVVTQPSDSELCVNDDVELLYANYIKRSGDVTSIAFRDKVLKAAMNAFGSASFFRWFAEQRVSPGMGDLQYRFLIDTLRYLQGGRRELQILLWENLIDATQAVEPPRAYVDVSLLFFGVAPNETQAKFNENLIDVLQLWCSRPNGIEDLLQTLHLLFGNP